MALRKIVFRTIVSVVLMSLGIAVKSQVISTVAGNGSAGYTTDIPPIPGISSRLNDPSNVTTNAAGDVFIADFNNHRIRKIDHVTGDITTFAGTTIGAYWGDGGPATAAAIHYPYGMDFDAAGNMYFCDFGNNLVRRISSTGIISTIAGLVGTLPAYTGDGGPATAAGLGNPMGIIVDLAGDIIIADQMNHVLRKINMTTGIISTIVGNGFIGISTAGDGGPASLAKLNYPHDLEMDAAGNIYITDYGNNRIRKITAATGIISTIAGIMPPPPPLSIYGFSGDGGPATAAQIYNPEGLEVDAAGNVYIADFSNHAIRKINPSGSIETIVGNAVSAFSGDGGPAIAGQLSYPMDVAVSPNGDIFIADKTNQRIRKIALSAPWFTAGASKYVIMCPTEFTTIDSALTVNDLDVGQILTWSPVTLPSHGTLVASYSTLSTGSAVTPSGTAYAPYPTYIGLDTFSVQVTDGTNYDTIEIIADLVGPFLAGTITGEDSVCPGQTITEVSSVTGGTWSSSDIVTATVASDGVVTGVTPGTATITYTNVHHCGTFHTYKTVTVIATVPCVNSVATTDKTATTLEIIPNPGHGHFEVSVNTGNSEPMQLQVIDVTGRCLLTRSITGNKTFPLDINVPPGVYTAIVNTRDGRVAKRLVVQ